MDRELYDFTLAFFRLFQAELKECVGGSSKATSTDKQEQIQVKLPPNLAEHFGKSELHLIFHGNESSHEMDLVAQGSRVFDQILSYLEKHSAATIQRLPSRFTGGEQLLQAIHPTNATIAGLRMQEKMQNLLLLNWHITYRADDKREELFTVLLDEEGDRLPFTENASTSETPLSIEAMLADAEPIPTQENTSGESEPIRLPPMTQLVRLAEDARKHVVYHADLRCVKHETEIQPRLYKVLKRLIQYYDDQIEEVYDTHDPTGEKRRTLEIDLERKIAEEVENHRMRVQVRLSSYALLEVPVAIADITLSDGKQEAPIQVRCNRYTGVMDRPPCHACHKGTEMITIDRNGHITCDGCLEQCNVCQDILCVDCGVQTCPVCNQGCCESCSNFCWACGERACQEHISQCPACRDSVCHACQIACACCGIRQCRSHLRADCVVPKEGTAELICVSCAIRCPGCQQFSAHLGSCSASGQRFCENCLTPCASCQRIVGPGFYTVSQTDGKTYCQNCLEECPACHSTTPKTVQCALCKTSCCTACSARCSVCNERGCSDHIHKNLECEHLLCQEHIGHCSIGGEIVCSLCHDVCAICERHFCSTHQATCKLCRCTYCDECIRSSLELCDTCATYERDGVVVNWMEEEIAGIPDVRRIMGRYEWSRVANIRYTIYIGKGPLDTGALILVEEQDEEPQVLVTRKLRSMAQYWRKY